MTSDIEFWTSVRNQIARRAREWSCGSEGRMIFENLVEHPDWLSRLQDLCPDNPKLTPYDASFEILTNYFSRRSGEEL